MKIRVQMVALVQAASKLPVFFLSILAGAIAECMMESFRRGRYFQRGTTDAVRTGPSKSFRAPKVMLT